MHRLLRLTPNADGSAIRTGISAAIESRERWIIAAALPGAVLFGAVVQASPKIGVAVLAAIAVLALALSAPLTLLVLIIVLTALVPYSVQHPLAIGGGQNSPGLLPSDALLLGGLFRAALVLPHSRLDRRRWFAVAAVTCFSALVLVQAARGMMFGRSMSVVGSEARHLLGFSVLLVALPVLEDLRARRQLLSWLLALGLALGVWGLAQWVLGLSLAGDVGVRQGVSLTSAGSGQLQGGLFGYPVIVILSVAALTSGEIRRLWVRRVVVLTLILGAADLLLTFERTLWVATAVGVAFLLLRTGARSRQRILIGTPILVVAASVGLAVFSPQTLTTARQRLLSIGQYSSDNSVRYRLIESEHVVSRIHAHPVVGAGLAATIVWGRPYDQVQPHTYNYSHMGYLWLAWKLGIPAAAILIVLMLAAVSWRGPPSADPVYNATRHGSQAALVAMLVVAATFPIFNSLEITTTLGLLLAICAAPRTTR